MRELVGAIAGPVVVAVLIGGVWVAAVAWYVSRAINGAVGWGTT
jgi:hypothetical protein